MKSEKKILFAFILNVAFSVFEFFGGIITGSVAILSDAVHDVGDALSIGISYFLEKKSHKEPDENFTFGYSRFSTLGALITTSILIIGSLGITIKAIEKILSPTIIDYNGMIIFALIGVLVNFCATLFTKGGTSLNQKAVNLHMLEDVFGWAVVLAGAIVMRFTDFALLDPILSLILALFIIINALKNAKEIINIFLEKAPCKTSKQEIVTAVKSIDGVIDTHHVHVWSLDEQNHFATLHVVTGADGNFIKKKVREHLFKLGITHTTIEIETPDEVCESPVCESNIHSHIHHHHSHTHHHH